ncbi:hypothetical protein P1X14_07340 [Sphingomonas sp. AOB5]|uniref:hypothetical protein n=1 Tax=Sphingomonas sp. AOB5 TaxID=3034017 RepID=UPI0023F7779A|nr:hypothetical protein [Sphingomonas sp. AOB5]MDF7775054.1 hypothetical protein [Sphingomonas sp. AOB5]
MLLRLLLALLIALPMPAMAAACHPAPVQHDMAAMAMAGHEHHAPAEPEPVKQLPAEHLCIGCVAPATILPPRVAAPVAHALPLSSPRLIGGEPLAAYAPETPPPRSEA